MMTIMEYWQVLGLSCLLGAAGAWVIAGWGHKIGLIDKPNFRSSHIIATPKGGGIGILFAFIALSCLLKVSTFLWGPCLVLSLVSFWGDKTELSIKTRLIIQFIVIGIAVEKTVSSISYPFSVVALYASELYKIVFFIIIVVFVVGTANIYNFMDGINGIAGITGIVAFGLIGTVAHSDEYQELSVLSYGLAFACAGFLPFNLINAKVFLGDVGSILLGSIFAFIIIDLSESILDFICFCAFLFPFYADELLTIIQRLINKESLVKSHRRHLYQVLANEGEVAHWKISLSYGVIQLSIGLILIRIKNIGTFPVILLLATFFGIFFIINYLIKQKYSL
jgi:UDP-N-acetylmuramyl pentapeptide phosphotransferase/UDP-N-acetylglucosamine-1-phosphate transferase